MEINFQELDDSMVSRTKKTLIALAMKEYSPTFHQFIFKLHVEKEMTGQEIYDYITQKAGRKIIHVKTIRYMLRKMGAWKVDPKCGKKKKYKKYKKCRAEDCKSAVPPENYWLCDRCKKRSNDILGEHSVAVGGAGFF